MITGSSRGLGKSLTKAVLEQGDIVVATARDISRLSDLQEQYGDKIVTAKLDVTKESDARNAVDIAFDQFGRLDILVNNAGYGNINSIEETSISEFRAEIETNLFGTIMVTKAVLPLMRKQGSGHIIQISSVGGRIGPIGRGAYAAAKWGIEGFSEVLAKEVGPLGIKVTIIEPGGFRTDFSGRSSSRSGNLPAYASTVGEAARFQLEYDGKQPGDPAKAAQVIISLTKFDEPPLRLLLGSDAVKVVFKNDARKMEDDKNWESLSTSTDFNSGN